MKPIIELKEVEIINDCVVVVNDFSIELIVDKIVGAPMPLSKTYYDGLRTLAPLCHTLATRPASKLAARPSVVRSQKAQKCSSLDGETFCYEAARDSPNFLCNEWERLPILTKNHSSSRKEPIPFCSRMLNN